MIFRDRLDAAQHLAVKLQHWRGKNPLVLAIPRGAVPMGAALAEALGGELDVVLVHKLASAWNPEYAVGAIDENGWFCVTDSGGADPEWLQRERAFRLEQLKKRRALYSPGRPALDAKGRVAIVVDDGIATGATMIAALHAVRTQVPQKLICAVPVAAPDSLETIRSLADETICLQAPPGFQAVGQFYLDFAQVEDAEVVACLRRTGITAQAQAVAAGDALLLVDVQNDFLSGGALAVPDGDAVIAPLAAWRQRFVAAARPVLATRDWHPPDHCSFHAQGGIWPPHCIAGTAGAEFAAALGVGGDVRVISKATQRDIDAYSGFDGTDLHAQLRELGVRRLFVGGLATDYCVLNTVRDALRLGYAVVLLLDGIRAVDVVPGDGERAIAEMTAGGALAMKG